MADLDRYKQDLVDIEAEWNKAEADIKAAEQINHKVSHPSIQELRYAGRRLVEVLLLIMDNGDPEKINDLLQDAEFNCLRARHDAIDSATSKVAVHLERTTDKLGPKIITDSFPEFSMMWGELAGIREKIVISREDRQNRTAIYETIEAGDFQVVARLYKRFLASETLMLKAARRERREKIALYALTGSALIVAFSAYIVTYIRG